MTRKPRKPRRMPEKGLTALLDGIKDAIDTLAQIADPMQRYEAARDLVEYLELHHEAP